LWRVFRDRVSRTTCPHWLPTSNLDPPDLCLLSS
jgi:hypothetical protein